MTAMMKNRADRYLSAAAMIAALPQSPTGMKQESLAGETSDPALSDVTRVYGEPRPLVRPAVGFETEVGTLRGAPRWPAWAASGLGAAAIVTVVALSAVAGSAPTLVPTAPSAAASSPPASPSSGAGGAPQARAPIPDLTGLKVAEATAMLTDSGFVLGSITALPSSLPADTVIGFDPPAGQSSVRGTVVSLQVASGSNVVPPVVGLTLTDAVAAVTSAGFGFLVNESGTGVLGSVTGVAPTSGQLLALGSTVVLETPRPVIAPTLTPTPSPTPTVAPSLAPGLGSSPSEAPSPAASLSASLQP